jgi:NAD(P)-dependent dehydrogenase (short-subunit alcohol dehydrogenase family)
METALELAQRGDHVILADRNVDGGEAVAQRIVADGGRAEFRPLDLGDLSRIRAFADDETSRGLPLEVLINNAGLLPPMQRATTRDGFELKFGVGFLGHFALTGLLLPALQRAHQPRVVSVASIAHGTGRIDLDDLQAVRKYQSYKVYAATKLACLMFALELDRRAKRAGSKLISVAAHPGVSKTPIAAGWEREDRRRVIDRLERISYRLFMRFVAQSAAQGAKPLIYAACEPQVTGGGYYGPTGFRQMSGAPGPVACKEHARDEAVAAMLWSHAEQLTQVRYAL